MKRILLIITIMLFSVKLLLAYDRLSGGLEAGWNVSYPFDATSLRSGFNIGVFGEFKISNKWFLDAAIRFSSRPWFSKESYKMGFGYPDECLWQVRSQNATPYELQLPIHLGFSCGISRNVRFRVALGPYFAVGLFGKGKSHYTIYGETNEDTKHISHPISNIYTDDTYAMNRFEVGLDSKIGVEVKRHYLVALGYQLQINNPSSSFCPIRQSQVFSINFGYKF